MICENCGEREATEHLSEITDASIRAGDLCRACYIMERGPVSLDEARRWMSTESSVGGDYSSLVDEWFERAHVHGQELPADVRAFIDRHRTRPTA